MGGARPSTLMDTIHRQIKTTGPITVAQYMETALVDPDQGYYATRDPLGVRGDFITSPEISQMFGELIGLWCAVTWREGNFTGPLKLVELGPGRGTLMADALRAAGGAAGFVENLDVHLVEASPQLREIQKNTVTSLALERPPQWHRHLAGVPDGPAFIIANEFFDALPIRQYQHHNGAWRERLIGLDGAGRLRFECTEAAMRVPGLATGDEAAGEPVEDGAIAEFCPAAVGLMTLLGRRLAAHGGAALIIDYGHADPGLGDTLQAVRAHKYTDPLAQPGEADLTAHVDFGLLAHVARQAGASPWGPLGQGDFLKCLGIDARTETLCQGLDGEAAAGVRGARDRLTGADQMGSLFKVLALTGPGAAAPPGFA